METLHFQEVVGIEGQREEHTPRRTDLRDAARMFWYYIGVPFAKPTHRTWLGAAPARARISFSRSWDRREAIFRTASLLGGMVLARAVQDPRLSDEILKSVRQKLG